MNIESAKQTFLEIKEVLDSLGIDFYLNHGILLGAIREGGFIPWDRDIDLRMPAEKQGSHVCEEFKKKGFLCRPTILYHDLISTYVLRKNRVKTDLALNHYYEPEDLVISLSGRPTIQFSVHPARFYRKARFIEFMGASTLVPYPPEEFLEFIYNKEWRTPVRDKSYLSGHKRISLEKYINYFIENGIK